MDDIWIISWFNHTAFDANPIWKSLKWAPYWPKRSRLLLRGPQIVNKEKIHEKTYI